VIDGEFGAGARSPAGSCIRTGSLVANFTKHGQHRRNACGARRPAERKAASTVDQQPLGGKEAGPQAGSAEPVKFRARTDGDWNFDYIRHIEDFGSRHAAIQIRCLDVGLDAENETVDLPIEPGLNATRETVGISPKGAYESIRDEQNNRIDVDRLVEVAPAITSVHADIEAGPVEARLEDDGFLDDRVCGVGHAGQAGGTSGTEKQPN